MAYDNKMKSTYQQSIQRKYYGSWFSKSLIGQTLKVCTWGSKHHEICHGDVKRCVKSDRDGKTTQILEDNLISS